MLLPLLNPSLERACKEGGHGQLVGLVPARSHCHLCHRGTAGSCSVLSVFLGTRSCVRGACEQRGCGQEFCNCALISCETVIPGDGDSHSLPGAALLQIRAEVALNCPRYVLNGRQCQGSDWRSLTAGLRLQRGPCLSLSGSLMLV